MNLNSPFFVGGYDPKSIYEKKMKSLPQNLMIYFLGLNSGTSHLPVGFSKQIGFTFLITSLLFNVTGCIMMPFHMTPIVNQTEEMSADSNVNTVLSQLIQEGVGELVVKDVPYERILIGATRIRDDFIRLENFRRALLETLRSRSNFQVLTQDEQMKSVPLVLEAIGAIAVLNGQLYKTGNELWLALQLRDFHSNRILWSGIFLKPLPKDLYHLEDTDSSITIGS